MKKITIALLVLAMGSTMKTAAQSRIIPVLEDNPNARTEAMGSTLLGNTSQMHIYTNPAAFTYGDKQFSIDASITGQPKTDEGRLMQYNLATGYQFKNHSALMAGVRYMGGLTIQPIAAVGETKEIKPYDVALDLGYSFPVTKEIAVYATATYARSHAETSTNALAFSVGAAYQTDFNLTKDVPTTLTVGARLMDFGKDVKFDNTGIPQSLPTSLVMGGDWNVRIAPKHALTYALSYRYFTPKDGHETLVGTGLEYTYNRIVSARVGYQHADKGSDAFTFGVGGQWAGFKLDIAYRQAFKHYGINGLIVGLGYSF